MVRENGTPLNKLASTTTTFQLIREVCQVYDMLKDFGMTFGSTALLGKGQDLVDHVFQPQYVGDWSKIIPVVAGNVN